MDSGCLGPGESLEDEFDVEKGILPQELIWLMDQMLNREVFAHCHCRSLLTRPGRMVDGLPTVADFVHVGPH